MLFICLVAFAFTRFGFGRLVYVRFGFDVVGGLVDGFFADCGF